MKRRIQFALLALLTLLLRCQFASAQWLVEDAINLVQNSMTAINTAQSVKHEYDLVVGQIEQLANDVRNLARIDASLNYFDVITSYGNNIATLLGHAQMLSYDLTQATAQFDALYQQLSLTASPADLLMQRRQMLTARLQASRMAVQMQSIRTNVQDVYGRLCSLLDGSWRASGNLDSAQLAAQQQALLTHSQQMAQAMLATSQRLEAQRQAEDVVLQQAAIQAYMQATTLAPVGQWEDGPQLSMTIRGRLD